VAALSQPRVRRHARSYGRAICAPHRTTAPRARSGKERGRGAVAWCVGAEAQRQPSWASWEAISSASTVKTVSFGCSRRSARIR
jgi:hypothetical protein